MKNTVGVFTLAPFKTYNKATVNLTVWYQHEQSPKINPTFMVN